MVYFNFSWHWPYGLITFAFVCALPRAPDMHLCDSLRSQGLAPPLCVALGQLHPTHCFKGPHTLAAQAGCSRVLARPAACLAAPAALAVSDVLPPCRAPLPVMPLLAIAHDHCSAYCPFSIQRFGLDPDPWPLGWTAPPSFAAFPRFSSLIATPTSVHVAMSLGCNVDKSNSELVTTALRWVAVIWLVIAPPPGRGEARRLPA